MRIIPYVNVQIDKHWARFVRQEAGRFGLFRNSPNVKPGRWGFWLSLGSVTIEIGSRNPGNRLGVALIRFGLWRV